MILADKIISLRKKNGWSQEELAEKMKVSRQSVSKWESATSIPDINKILELGRIFGVTTDYLLKDDEEQESYTEQDEVRLPRISLREATEFMDRMVSYGRQIGLGVMLCILSPALLILLSGLSEEGIIVLSEETASSLGVIVLLVMVAAAVAIFIFSGARMKPFEPLKKGRFELDYGVQGIVQERRQAQENVNTCKIVAGVVLCILSAIPLIGSGIAAAPDWVCIAEVALLLVLVAVAVYLFVSAGMVTSSFEQLLREGEFDTAEREKNRRGERFGGIYWPAVTAVYLAWSFLTMDWRITWIIWPVAGCLFAAISAALRKED